MFQGQILLITVGYSSRERSWIFEDINWETASNGCQFSMLLVHSTTRSLLTKIAKSDDELWNCLFEAIHAPPDLYIFRADEIQKLSNSRKRRAQRGRGSRRDVFNVVKLASWVNPDFALGLSCESLRSYDDMSRLGIAQEEVGVRRTLSIYFKNDGSWMIGAGGFSKGNLRRTTRKIICD